MQRLDATAAHCTSSNGRHVSFVLNMILGYVHARTLDAIAQIGTQGFSISEFLIDTFTLELLIVSLVFLTLDAFTLGF